GSANHFFSTVYKGTTEAEGYHVYLRKQVDNPDRQPEDLIETKIQQFSNHAFAKTKSTVFSAADSLLYWRKEKQKPKKIQFLDTTKVNMASLARRFNSDL